MTGNPYDIRAAASCIWSKLLVTCLVVFLPHLARCQPSDSIVLSDFRSGKNYIDKPGEDSADIQKALFYAQDAAKRCAQAGLTLLAGQCETLFAQIYREKGEKQRGFEHAQKAVKILALFPLTEQLADADFEMANYYVSNSDAISLSRKTEYYGKGVAIIKILYPYSRRLADAQKFLGDLLNLGFREEEALAELNQALTVYKQLHYSQLQDIYSLLANVWLNAGYPKQALGYALSALRTSETFKDSSMTVCAMYFRLGMIYIGLKSFDLASNSFQKAKFYADKNKDLLTSLMTAGAIAHTYNYNKEPEKALRALDPLLRNCPDSYAIIKVYLLSGEIDADMALDNDRAALSCYDEMLHIIWNIPTNLTLLKHAHNSAINLLIKTHRFANLDRHLQALRDVLHAVKTPDDLRLIEHLAYVIDSAKGNYRMAMIHYRRYSTLRDTAIRRNHDRDVDLLQIQYNAEKIDEELAAKEREVQLLTTESQLQAKALKTGRLRRKLAFALAVLALLSIGLIINRYLYRVRSGRLLEKSQEKIDAQNTTLKKLAGEREWLLKELHHRVKNNLQIVISLLNSQMAFIEDSDALDLVKESQARMQAISLIHQRLYQSDDLSGIDMNSYIYDLCNFLKATFFDGRKIEMVVDADRIRLDVQQAMPLGLIINEALINCLKYAFNESQGNCRINIGLCEEDNHQMVLMLADNGASGFPLVDTAERDRLSGRDVMRMFAGQLMGKITFVDDGPGSRLTLRFTMMQTTN